MEPQCNVNNLQGSFEACIKFIYVTPLVLLHDNCTVSFLADEMISGERQEFPH